MAVSETREVGAVEAVERALRRIDEVDPKIHAVVERFDEQALAEAKAIDERLSRGERIGPLAGVPVSIKECFYQKGTCATVGLTTRKDLRAEEDGLAVARLRRAGAIPLCKTNVPQLMIWHECDNPVYGRTNNPWDLERTPGGSSGGEGALVASGASTLGLASDLGGSIRVPAHFCGVHGFKPTNGLVPRAGTMGNLIGMNAILFQNGPIAREVRDLARMLQALTTPHEGESRAAPHAWEVRGVPWTYEPAEGVRGMKIGVWKDDGYFPPCPAIRRAVDEAAEALANEGATVVDWTPPDPGEAVRLYFAILGSDGGVDARRLVAGSMLDSRVAELLRIGKIPSAARPAIAQVLKLQGQKYQAELLIAARPRDASGYWALNSQMTEYQVRFYKEWERAGLQAAICPPHATPAGRHGDGIQLIPAASYAFLMNLVGFPAGTVSLTRVRDDEATPRAKSSDVIVQAVRRTEEGSAGLPVGVQVVAPHWEDSRCLSVMEALERLFRDRQDYPPGVVPPGIAQ